VLSATTWAMIARRRVASEPSFDMVEHFARRADAANSQYFSALFCASAQDSFKHSFLWLQQHIYLRIDSTLSSQNPRR
jgi:hypothetical protein